MKRFAVAQTYTRNKNGTIFHKINVEIIKAKNDMEAIGKYQYDKTNDKSFEGFSPIFKNCVVEEILDK